MKIAIMGIYILLSSYHVGSLDLCQRFFGGQSTIPKLLFSLVCVMVIKMRPVVFIFHPQSLCWEGCSRHWQTRTGSRQGEGSNKEGRGYFATTRRLRPSSIGQISLPTEYGRPVRKSTSKHGRQSNPNPKFIGTAEAYFVCHWPKISGFLDFAFIWCP